MQTFDGLCDLLIFVLNVSITSLNLDINVEFFPKIPIKVQGILSMLFSIWGICMRSHKRLVYIFEDFLTDIALFTKLSLLRE